MPDIIRGSVGHISLQDAIKKLEIYLKPPIQALDLGDKKLELEKTTHLKAQIFTDVRKLSPSLVHELEIFQTAIKIYNYNIKIDKHRSESDLLKSHLLLSMSHLEALKIKHKVEFSNDELSNELTSDLVEVAMCIGKTSALIHLDKIKRRFLKNSITASKGGQAKNHHITKQKEIVLKLAEEMQKARAWTSISKAHIELAEEISRHPETYNFSTEQADYGNLPERFRSWRANDPSFKNKFDSILKIKQ